MELFLLTRVGVTDYDQYDSFIIRAESEKKAREFLVSKRFTGSYQEGEKKVWLDSSKSTCEKISKDGDAEILLGSFNAG